MIKPTLTISFNHIGFGYERDRNGSWCWHALIEVRWRDVIRGSYFPRINVNRREWRCTE